MCLNSSTSKYQGSERAVTVFMALRMKYHTGLVLDRVVREKSNCVVIFYGYHSTWIFSSAQWLILLTNLWWSQSCQALLCKLMIMWYLVSKPCNHSKCFPICVAYLWFRTLFAFIRFTYEVTKPLKHECLLALDCSMTHFENCHILIIRDGRLWN